MVANSAWRRPMRSPIQPNSTPPAAQLSSSSEVMVPLQNTAASWAAGEPGERCSSTGMQLGATKLNSTASNMSKPQPAQPAAITSHWYPEKPRKPGRDALSDGECNGSYPCC